MTEEPEVQPMEEIVDPASSLNREELAEAHEQSESPGEPEDDEAEDDEEEAEGDDDEEA